MQIYVELFYNNVESFLASAFPVAKSVLDPERWQTLVRTFLHRHPSETPYFLEISQEFLTFLADARPAGLPPFLLELCHYEWVELALAVAEEEIPDADLDRHGDLARGIPAVSPLIWRLAYRYPVHRIGPLHQPEAPGAEPTQLVVYRRRDDSVHFMEVSTLTMVLLEKLETGNVSGAETVAALAAEASGLDPEVVRSEGLRTLERLRACEIILGTRIEALEAGEVDT